MCCYNILRLWNVVCGVSLVIQCFYNIFSLTQQNLHKDDASYECYPPLCMFRGPSMRQKEQEEKEKTKEFKKKWLR